MSSQSLHEERKVRTSYGIVFIALVIFTAIEVAVSYLPENIRIPVLIVLAVIKAALIVLYFMHLKSDSRLYTLFVIIGVVLVSPIALILVAVMPTVK